MSKKTFFSKGTKAFTQNLPRTNRQLKVGEAIRRILADVFLKRDFPDPALSSHSITVTQVGVSPDLKRATVFVIPLLGENNQEVIELLSQQISFFRQVISKQLTTKSCPTIQFALDETIEHAQKIDRLLKSVCPAGNDQEDA